MTSKTLFETAQKYIPGGVNSPVRAFSAIDGDPVFFDHAKGAYLYDVDGRRYTDYVGSWGPMILGHNHPAVVDAIKNTVEKSISFGAPCELEVKLAKKVCELMPNIEKVRMVSSGTEATMSAIRLARGFTKRNKIIKFEGCYHGHADCLLVKSGSGTLTFGQPNSAGVTPGAAQDTLVANFNDLTSVETLFSQHPNEIACIIVEPIAANMNFVAPTPEFLTGLRALCDQHKSLLIFDEVITGFRVHLGGAQTLFNIKPDLTALGKIIGGGMPVGAFGGRADIVDHMAPLGPVYQAGTLSGNPIAMAAGLTTLELISTPDFFDSLTKKTEYLVHGLKKAAEKHQVSFQVNTTGGLFGLFFTDAKEVTSFQDVMACDAEQFKKFFHLMLDKGFYLAPSAFEAGFVSSAHSMEDIEQTIQAADESFSAL